MKHPEPQATPVGLTIDGHFYTEGQLGAAINAAWLLSVAYARADEDNGGGGSVEWEDVNEAHCFARSVFSDDKAAMDELNGDARAYNDVGTEDESEALETCEFCGIRAESVCDSPPPAECEQAVNAVFGGWLKNQAPAGALVERKKVDDTEGGSCD